MPRSALIFTVAACLAGAPPAAGAQSPNGSAAAPATTQVGVFTAAQASAGRTVYSMQCSACHSTSTHSGPAFMKSWQGRTVWDLYSFIRETMPQSDPGALSEQEYLHVTTYLLSLNKMPAGQRELPTDQAKLKAIRIDTTSVSPAAAGTGAPHSR